ncbi:MAG: DUF1385 domain-containing protein [Chloroflexi bacterium]|nr:DUF1385 domain-containing protein [Chloroflexota bacterium]
MARKFNYGGQAVIEGVMMRGAHIAAIAVRDPDGEIIIREEPLNATLYRGWVSRLPFVRGLVGLWDALVLGTNALMWSAEIAATEEDNDSNTKSGKSRSITSTLGMSLKAMMAATEAPVEKHSNRTEFTTAEVIGVVTISLSMGIGLFFLAPAASSSFIGKSLGLENRLAVDAIEGGIKLAIFVGYIAAIGMMDDVKRLFGYHGAEHKTINAYEAGAELRPDVVKDFPIEHPRCGTAFLLTVVLLSIFVHTLVGRPDNIILLLLSRILVIPVIAGLAYEILRFTAKNASNPIVRALIVPNLAMQRLTTRQPDESMIEVAIEALERVLAAEEAHATDSEEEIAASVTMPAAATINTNLNN